MIHGKKTAGILTELKAEMEGIHYIIVGIGINANNTRFPKMLRDHVTSLSLELKKKSLGCKSYKPYWKLWNDGIM